LNSSIKVQAAEVRKAWLALVASEEIKMMSGPLAMKTLTLSKKTVAALLLTSDYWLNLLKLRDKLCVVPIKNGEILKSNVGSISTSDQ
jgi:hypothetical protein